VFAAPLSARCSGTSPAPSPESITNPAMLCVAIGIIGASVMPHNRYLYSSIVQTRD
jgi:manganese transport protein